MQFPKFLALGERIRQRDFAKSSRCISGHLVTSKAAMFKIARRKLAARLLRLSPVRTARRFVRQQDGGAAIQFSFIAVLFLALLCAILKMALVFFATQTLEAAAADSARLV